MAAESGKGAGRASGGYAGLLGGLKDFAQQAKENTSELAQQAQSRVQSWQAGKKMLDEGGPEMEAKLLAKKTANDAVNLDKGIVAKLSDDAQVYADAAQKMKVAGDDDNSALAQAYEARAQALISALELLTPVPSAPEITTMENDAIQILLAKGKYRWVASKTQEGFNTLKVTTKSSESAPAPT
mmetsp:Transcript_102128/g.202752  ORF Transcript_102128/g.202752 Transcript_102128/m.202752 type:complete len:184 (+) Transcript_102128:83-634(+)|eukprot:CAMPEP_0172699056 /NCGR_PEP_ID=MMETSP1074-20121228/29905_1 /TAXON_ID=2916 /ORGANISM="Ceratium fusus, Strain PA161109" /LENGTH=183 /DNA_ID=CAMNT_0013520193 /DNA_START=65 /DNA_END=616 /DNA_ORIENTATION=-